MSYQSVYSEEYFAYVKFIRERNEKTGIPFKEMTGHQSEFVQFVLSNIELKNKIASIGELETIFHNLTIFLKATHKQTPILPTKIVCCIDEYGHFQCAKLDERDKVWNIITTVVESGDCFANLKDSITRFDLTKSNFDYNKLSEKEWFELILEFTQRNTFEIIDL